LNCGRKNEIGEEWEPRGPSLCPVSEIEKDPWILSAVRASNIELSPRDTCLWYWSMIEAIKAERARVLKERSLPNG
tara:strand:+ start:264 stop:491 length:228 start_codon:yes stop_codon:yes gene_type:complete